MEPFTCGNCGDGIVQSMYGFNRSLCDNTPIPTYYPVMTCEDCGETWFTYDECVELEQLAQK